MHIRRAPREQHFTIVANEVIEDRRLSFRARGVLLFLLSKPDDWRTTSDEIARDAIEGRDALRAAFKELVAAGYLHHRKIQGTDGRWRTETILYDMPVEHASPTPGNPSSVPPGQTEIDQVVPTPGKPYVGAPGVIPSTETKTEVTPNGVTSPPAARKRNDVWDAVMEVCGINTSDITDSVRRGYGRCVSEITKVGATADDVYVRADVYRVRWPNASLTPFALAKQWAACAPNPQHLPAFVDPGLATLARLDAKRKDR